MDIKAELFSTDKPYNTRTGLDDFTSGTYVVEVTQGERKKAPKMMEQ